MLVDGGDYGPVKVDVQHSSNLLAMDHEWLVQSLQALPVQALAPLAEDPAHHLLQCLHQLCIFHVDFLPAVSLGHEMGTLQCLQGHTEGRAGREAGSALVLALGPGLGLKSPPNGTVCLPYTGSALVNRSHSTAACLLCSDAVVLSLDWNPWRDLSAVRMTANSLIFKNDQRRS